MLRTGLGRAVGSFVPKTPLEFGPQGLATVYEYADDDVILALEPEIGLPRRKHREPFLPKLLLFQ